MRDAGSLVVKKRGEGRLCALARGELEGPLMQMGMGEEHGVAPPTF